VATFAAFDGARVRWRCRYVRPSDSREMGAVAALKESSLSWAGPRARRCRADVEGVVEPLLTVEAEWVIDTAVLATPGLGSEVCNFRRMGEPGV